MSDAKELERQYRNRMVAATNSSSSHNNNNNKSPSAAKPRFSTIATPREPSQQFHTTFSSSSSGNDNESTYYSTTNNNNVNTTITTPLNRISESSSSATPNYNIGGIVDPKERERQYRKQRIAATQQTSTPLAIRASVITPVEPSPASNQKTQFQTQSAWSQQHRERNASPTPTNTNSLTPPTLLSHASFIPVSEPTDFSNSKDISNNNPTITTTTTDPKERERQYRQQRLAAATTATTAPTLSTTPRQLNPHISVVQPQEPSEGFQRFSKTEQLQQQKQQATTIDPKEHERQQRNKLMLASASESIPYPKTDDNIKPPNLNKSISDVVIIEPPAEPQTTTTRISQPLDPHDAKAKERQARQQMIAAASATQTLSHVQTTPALDGSMHDLSFENDTNRKTETVPDMQSSFSPSDLPGIQEPYEGHIDESNHRSTTTVPNLQACITQSFHQQPPPPPTDAAASPWSRASKESTSSKFTPTASPKHATKWSKASATKQAKATNLHPQRESVGNDGNDTLSQSSGEDVKRRERHQRRRMHNPTNQVQPGAVAVSNNPSLSNFLQSNNEDGDNGPVSVTSSPSANSRRKRNDNDSTGGGLMHRERQARRKQQQQDQQATQRTSAPAPITVNTTATHDRNDVTAKSRTRRNRVMLVENHPAPGNDDLIMEETTIIPKRGDHDDGDVGVSTTSKGSAKSSTKSKTNSVLSPEQRDVISNERPVDLVEGTVNFQVPRGAIAVRDSDYRIRTKAALTQQPQLPNEFDRHNASNNNPETVTEDPSQIEQEQEFNYTTAPRDGEEAGKIEQPKNSRWKCYILLCVLVVGAIVGVVVAVTAGGGNDGGMDNGPTNNSDDGVDMIDPERYAAGLTVLMESTLFSIHDDYMSLLDDATTPQAQAFDWILNTHTVIDNNDVFFAKFILATFYYSLNGDAWTMITTKWLQEDIDYCTWEMIDCDTDTMHQVVSINTTVSRNLQGTIPFEIFQLPLLVSLTIQNNQVSLPTEYTLGNTIEKLDLKQTKITSTIPSNIYEASSLRYLNLIGCQLTGTIGSFENLPLLNTLYLNENDLQGTLSSQFRGNLALEDIQLSSAGSLEGRFDDIIEGLENLGIVEFADIDLSGILPSDIGTKHPKLMLISLHGTNVGGTIPTEIGLLTDLVISDLEDANINGTIPTEFGNLRGNLESLTLTSNMLTGPIPSELGSLGLLKQLSLNSNPGINGTIPTELGNLSSLQNLRLSRMSLGGSIPSELGKLTNSARIELNQNDLFGSIPNELASLRVLDLSGNFDLTGMVPCTQINVFITCDVVDCGDCAVCRCG